jgi:holin-like protein
VLGLVLRLAGRRLEFGRGLVVDAAEGLLAHLSLLFVPVGVGVITHLDVVSAYGVRLLAVVVLSTWIGMAVTALVLARLLRSAAPGDAEARDG